MGEAVTAGAIAKVLHVLEPRSLSMKQAVGLVRLKLPYGNCPAIIASPGYDAPLSPALGERS